MNDEILRLAQEAGLCWPDIKTNTIEQRLERFAFLVAAAYREACAKVCEQVGEPNPDDPNSALGEYYRDSVCYECAAAIRAMSNK